MRHVKTHCLLQWPYGPFVRPYVRPSVGLPPLLTRTDNGNRRRLIAVSGEMTSLTAIVANSSHRHGTSVSAVLHGQGAFAWAVLHG